MKNPVLLPLWLVLLAVAIVVEASLAVGASIYFDRISKPFYATLWSYCVQRWKGQYLCTDYPPPNASCDSARYSDVVAARAFYILTILVAAATAVLGPTLMFLLPPRFSRQVAMFFVAMFGILWWTSLLSFALVAGSYHAGPCDPSSVPSYRKGESIADKEYTKYGYGPTLMVAVWLTTWCGLLCAKDNLRLGPEAAATNNDKTATQASDLEERLVTRTEGDTGRCAPCASASEASRSGQGEGVLQLADEKAAAAAAAVVVTSSTTTTTASTPCPSNSNAKDLLVRPPFAFYLPWDTKRRYLYRIAFEIGPTWFFFVHICLGMCCLPGFCVMCNASPIFALFIAILLPSAAIAGMRGWSGIYVTIVDTEARTVTNQEYQILLTLILYAARRVTVPISAIGSVETCLGAESAVHSYNVRNEYSGRVYGVVDTYNTFTRHLALSFDRAAQGVDNWVRSPKTEPKEVDAAPACQDCCGRAPQNSFFLVERRTAGYTWKNCSCSASWAQQGYDRGGPDMWSALLAQLRLIDNADGQGIDTEHHRTMQQQLAALRKDALAPRGDDTCCVFMM